MWNLVSQLLDLIFELEFPLDSKPDLILQLYPEFEKEDIAYRRIEEAKRAVSEYLGIPKNCLDIPVEIKPLAVEYIALPSPHGYLILEKKVLGEYDPHEDKIYLDPILLYDDAALFRTALHEYIHRAQKVSGEIYCMDREELEREAYALTDEIISHYS